MVSVDVTLLQKWSEFFNEHVCDFSFTFFFLNNVIFYTTLPVPHNLKHLQQMYQFCAVSFNLIPDKMR